MDLDYITQEASAAYSEDVEGSALYTGHGLATAIFFLESGGSLKDLPEAYSIGELVGLNVRVVDDLLDGDGCDSVDDRTGFLDRYIEVLDSGEHPEETGDISIPLRTAEITHDYFDPETLEDIVMQTRDMRDLAEEEVKNTREGYLEYVDVAGGHTGELTALALNEIEGFHVDSEDIEYAFDAGVAGQVVDDIYDDDLELDQEELEDIKQDKLEKISRHVSENNRFTGTIILKGSDAFPAFADTVKKIFGDYKEEE